jgi:hypothetical protein
MLIALEETGKNQLQPSQESMCDFPVLSFCSLLGNSIPKPTGVLEHNCEGQTYCWSSIFRGDSF